MVMPAMLKAILIFSVMSTVRNGGQTSRRLLSAAGGLDPLPFRFNEHDACAICMDRLRTPNKHTAFNETICSLSFPECHGFQFCESCVSRVLGDKSESNRRCPICRRRPASTSPRGNPLLLTRIPRAVDAEELYHRYISRMQIQQNDTSYVGHLKIYNVYHPCRHSIRNQYYCLVSTICCRPIFEREWLTRSPRGCWAEYAKLLLSEPTCVVFDIIAVAAFVVGNTISGCCCCFNCFRGTFCRDFCLCEPPMDPVDYALFLIF